MTAPHPAWHAETRKRGCDTMSLPKTQPLPDPAFGVALKAAREAKGISQGQLARLIDCDGTYISRLESIKRGPSRTIAERLANVLGDEVLIAGGFIPAGYRVVKDESS